MRVGQYARHLPRRGRRVLYADDLFSKRYASMRERHPHRPVADEPARRVRADAARVARRLAATPMVYRPLLALEERLTARSEERAPADFDATILVNPTETEELTQRSGSDSVRTLLPLLREPARRDRRFDGTPTFVFLGGLDFPPNRDGLTWFLRECREPVLEALPGFRLLVAGRATHDLPREADAWQGRVRPLGWVEDLDGLLLGAAALISRCGSAAASRSRSSRPWLAVCRWLRLRTESTVSTSARTAASGRRPEPEGWLACWPGSPTRVHNATLSAAPPPAGSTPTVPAVAARDYDQVLVWGRSPNRRAR
jgi:hypothetical protein